jgi:hypothetical protein
MKALSAFSINFFFKTGESFKASAYFIPKSFSWHLEEQKNSAITTRSPLEKLKRDRGNNYGYILAEANKAAASLSDLNTAERIQTVPYLNHTCGSPSLMSVRNLNFFSASSKSSILFRFREHIACFTKQEAHSYLKWF